MLIDLALSSTFWTLLQFVLFQWPDLTHYKLKRVPYLDMRNRMVSFLHGLMCIAVTSYLYLTENSYCGSQATKNEYGLLITSCGYFAYDFLAMAYFGLLDFDMTLHHLLCISGMLFTLHEDRGANFIAAGIFIAEVSNPAMHMRVMLKHIGLRYSRAYEVAEFAYFISFFMGRIVLGHPVVFNTLTCDKLNIPAKFICCGVMAQSYQFLYRMYFIV